MVCSSFFSFEISLPFTKISPFVGVSNPPTKFKKVLFPYPVKQSPKKIVDFCN